MGYFNFELDVAQLTEFDINGSKEITLFNPGSNMIASKIIASDSFEVV